MADQPSFQKYEPTAQFPNGTSARPIPEGAVAREWKRSDDPLATGLKPGKTSPAPAGDKANTPAPGAPNDPGKFADAFPLKVTAEDVKRGQERYSIFCVVCHGPLGDGNGKVPERGYTHPPSYHTSPAGAMDWAINGADGKPVYTSLPAGYSRGFDRYGVRIPLRDVPPGYVFEVITRGYGAMPRYAPQIPPADRWRIVAYVRALQLSQHAPVGELPEADRAAVKSGEKP